jgi:dihydroorotase
LKIILVGNFMTQSFIINRPDDWHLHLRDGELLQHTVPASTMHFARALVMPNLKPALTSLPALIAYRERIVAHIPSQASFVPYMTFYLNESLAIDDVAQAAKNPFVLGAKLYPAGATTNSEAGVESLRAVYPQLEALQAHDLVLQIHGETTSGDIFAREALFIERQLKPLLADFPRLRIVLEHISTKAAVDFVTEAPPQVAATITAHHLLYNRNHLLSGGVKPHYYCLPILKKESDQLVLQEAATSGNPKFFAGTDSAPHAKQAKESSCGCAGIYSAPYALAAYAQVFDAADKLAKLNNFTSRFGAAFYKLAANDAELELIRSPQTIPPLLPLGKDSVVPMGAGTTLNWSVHENA